jgi:hypothetical protein
MIRTIPPHCTRSKHLYHGDDLYASASALYSSSRRAGVVWSSASCTGLRKK